MKTPMKLILTLLLLLTFYPESQAQTKPITQPDDMAMWPYNPLPPWRNLAGIRDLETWEVSIGSMSTNKHLSFEVSMSPDNKVAYLELEWLFLNQQRVRQKFEIRTEPGIILHRDEILRWWERGTCDVALIASDKTEEALSKVSGQPCAKLIYYGGEDFLAEFLPYMDKLPPRMRVLVNKVAGWYGNEIESSKWAGPYRRITVTRYDETMYVTSLNYSNEEVTEHVTLQKSGGGWKIVKKRWEYDSVANRKNGDSARWEDTGPDLISDQVPYFQTLPTRLREVAEIKDWK